MRRLIIAICLLSGFGLLLFWQSQRSGAGGFRVDVATVKQGVLADSTLASGNLVFAEQIQLRSEVSGRVAEVLVEEGQDVLKGDLLLRLDPESFESDLESAEAGKRASELEIDRRRAQVDDIARRVRRQRQLYEKRLVGQEAFEQLENQQKIAMIEVHAAEQSLRQQQARQNLARDQLERSLFRAPINGMVISVDLKVGETVIASANNLIGTNLLVLADPSVLLAELRVDEADIARVAIGQSVQVYAAAYPKTVLLGRVVRIGSSAQQSGNTLGLMFKVRVKIESKGLNLRPGTSCRAEIITVQGASSLNVPIAAVRRDDQGQYVWRVSSDFRAERVSVSVGIANDFSQAVLSGLVLGDRVVIGPGRTLAQLGARDRLQLSESNK